MNSSGARERAAERNSGRSSRRPTRMMPARPAQAIASAVSGRAARPPWGATMATAISSGATIRSWNSRTANTERPARACRRPASAIAGRPMAVEDMARAAPTASAAGQPSPKRVAATAIRPPVSRNSPAPKPNTWRHISRNRSNDSSSPIENSRNTTPSSAMSEICSGLATVK